MIRRFSFARTYPLLLVLGAVVASLGAGELIIRAVGYHPPLQSAWYLEEKSPSDRVLDRNLIFIRPEFLDSSFYATDPQRRTILTIGDSFTEGASVGREYRYPVELGRVLNQEGMSVETINAGIGDSGPDQHFRLLNQYLLPRLHPEIVVWAFYSNDIWDNYLKAVYRVDGDRLVFLDGGRNWLYIRQLIHMWTPLPRWIKQRSYLYRVLMKGTESLDSAQLPYQYAEDPSAWGLEKLRLEIQSIKELGEEKGFVTYFVLIAPQSAYLAQTDPELWNSYWSIPAHETLLAEFRDEPNFIEAWFPSADHAELFADSSRDAQPLGDHHFNEAGYALLAEVIAERILRDEQLDPEFVELMQEKAIEPGPPN